MARAKSSLRAVQLNSTKLSEVLEGGCFFIIIALLLILVML
jgi:hypothetical protein